MAAIKQAQSATTAITCSLVNIASYSSREATNVVNTVNLYLDAILFTAIQFAAAPVGDCWIILDSTPDATNFANPATGADAAIVVPQIDKLGGEVMGQQHAGTDLIMLGKHTNPSIVTTTGTSKSLFGSVAAAFGGNLPAGWAPVYVNATGQAFGATTAGILTWYIGVSATSV